MAAPGAAAAVAGPPTRPWPCSPLGHDLGESPIPSDSQSSCNPITMAGWLAWPGPTPGRPGGLWPGHQGPLNGVVSRWGTRPTPAAEGGFQRHSLPGSGQSPSGKATTVTSALVQVVSSPRCWSSTASEDASHKAPGPWAPGGTCCLVPLGPPAPPPPPRTHIRRRKVLEGDRCEG